MGRLTPREGVGLRDPAPQSTSAQHSLQLTPDSTAPPQYSAKTHQLMLYTLFLGARFTWQHLSS